MYYILTPLSTITLYLISTLLLLMKLRGEPHLVSINKYSLLMPGFLAVLLHLLTLSNSMVSTLGVNLGFYNALSLVGAIITLFTLISALRHEVEIMTTIAMPLSAMVVTLDSIYSSNVWMSPGSPPALIFHILSSLVAYSLLALAALHAIILSFQNSYLHSHQPGGILRLIPPLKIMESLLFETIVIGFLCLSISLGTGLLFLEDMFAQHIAHKTILSIIAWFVFAILLMGRWVFGWRGRTAIRWTLTGFISLMLAYFGSKFVLEIILS